MEKTELVEYELANIPLASYVSNDFLQTLLSKFLARRVNKKWDKYQKFLKLKAFYKRFNSAKSVNK